MLNLHLGQGKESRECVIAVSSGQAGAVADEERKLVMIVGETVCAASVYFFDDYHFACS